MHIQAYFLFYRRKYHFLDSCVAYVSMFKQLTWFFTCDYSLVELYIHWHICKVAFCTLSVSLEIRHCPLTFYTPLPAIMSASRSSLCLSWCPYANLCLETVAHISAVYLSLCFHSACIPCSLIRSGWRGMERGNRGKMVGKSGNQKYFPTNWFWSVHIWVSAGMCVKSDHIDEGERTKNKGSA